MEKTFTRNNSIVFPGSFSGRNLKESLAALYRMAEKQGFEDVVLDFGGCTAVYESAMVPFIAYLDFLRKNSKIDFEIFLPKDRKIAGIFLNAGWAHFLDPEHFDLAESKSAIHTQIATYKNSDEQFVVVDNLISVFLNSMKIERDSLNAIEWSLNEITDNVLNHAGDGVAGYVQALKYSNKNIIEFIVADSGVGIPRSLDVSDNNEALERSIQQGVTRNKETNQGNGLYGSFNIARVAKGQFNIQSYYGNLFLTDDGKVRYRKEVVPYHGTFVRWSVNCNEPDIIKRALKFGDREHEISFGYVERIYGEEPSLVLSMKKEFKSFRSREAGKLAHNRISNLIRQQSGKTIRIDFGGVDVISSSFADEVFGRLFVGMGPIVFGQVIQFQALNRQVGDLIDRAIIQRASTVSS